MDYPVEFLDKELNRLAGIREVLISAGAKPYKPKILEKK